MENLNNLPPFFKGQKVVCIKSHSQGIFRKGQTFTVTSVEFVCCAWVVRVGIKNVAPFCQCNCLKLYPSGLDSDFEPSCFAPLQEQKFPLIKLSKIIEKELVSAN